MTVITVTDMMTSLACLTHTREREAEAAKEKLKAEDEQEEEQIVEEAHEEKVRGEGTRRRSRINKVLSNMGKVLNRVR